MAVPVVEYILCMDFITNAWLIHVSRTPSGSMLGSVACLRKGLNMLMWQVKIM